MKVEIKCRCGSIIIVEDDDIMAVNNRINEWQKIHNGCLNILFYKSRDDSKPKVIDMCPKIGD